MAVSGLPLQTGKPSEPERPASQIFRTTVSMTYEGSIDMLIWQLVQSVSTEQRRFGFVLNRSQGRAIRKSVAS
jgi:hypothetical protein